jgi:hypothetical protein
MLEFEGFHAGLCRTLLAQMSDFAAMPPDYSALASRGKSDILEMLSHANLFESLARNARVTMPHSCALS